MDVLYAGLFIARELHSAFKISWIECCFALFNYALPNLVCYLNLAKLYLICVYWLEESKDRLEIVYFAINIKYMKYEFSLFL